MPETIILNPLTPPTNCIPNTYGALIAGVAQYIQAIFNPAYALFNYGANTPAPDQQNRPWFRLDANGQPIGWMSYYNGAWRRVGPFVVGDIIMTSGPGENSEYYDSTGKGISGTQAEGWSLCNGQNSTPDLRNRFIAGGVSYNGGSWVTNVDPSAPNSASGGRGSITLNRGQIPQLQASINRGSLTGNGGGFVYGFKNGQNDFDLQITNGQGLPGGVGNPVYNTPFYYALAYKQWMPYA